MRSRDVTLAGVVAGGLLLAGSVATVPSHPACAQQNQISYAEDIAPIFRGWCVSCHQPGGEGYEASQLDLTTYEGLMAGTKFGPMVVPGEPDRSNLIVLIEGQADIRMPLGHKQLPSCLRRNIWTWIFQGAKNN
jgi:mono/diheme cytochrome c family protein